LHNIKSLLEAEKAVSAFCFANRTMSFSAVILRHGDFFWCFLKCIRILLELFEAATIFLSSENSITADRMVFTYFDLVHKLSTPTLFDPPATEELANDGMEEAIEICKACAAIVTKHLKDKFEPLQPAEKMALALNPAMSTFTEPSSDTQRLWNRILEEGYDHLAQRGRGEPKHLELTERTIPNPMKAAPGWLNELASDSVVAAEIPDNIFDAELARFKSVRVPPVGFDLVAWWKVNQAAYPNMAKLARQYLSIPASQTASERDFSQMRLLCTHLRQTMDPWRAYKLSVVGPYIRRNRTNNSTSSQRKDLDAQRALSRGLTRRAGLKRRYSAITPNPLPSAAALEELREQDQFFDTPDSDDGERESDSDYTDAEEESQDNTFLEDADDDFLDLQPVQKVAKTCESAPFSHRDRITCEIRQSSSERYYYSATFVNLKKRAPPSVKALFGPNASYIEEWKEVFDGDQQYWSFVASEQAQKTWTSGKQFLRHIGEIVAIVPEMFDETVDC
jgi:hypothetical protein